MLRWYLNGSDVILINGGISYFDVIGIDNYRMMYIFLNEGLWFDEYYIMID